MDTVYRVIALVAVAANGFSGIVAMARPEPIMRILRPALERAEVPGSWVVFPIGTLKTAGALGVLIGLLGVPIVGTAAAVGLVLFFVCAVYTHLRANDYSPQFLLAACFFLPLAVATLILDLLA